MRSALSVEPFLVEVEEPVEVAGPPPGQVQEAQAQRMPGFAQRGVGAQQQGNGAGQPGAVHAAEAVEHEGILTAVEYLDKVFQFVGRRQVAGGQADVFQRQVEAVGAAAFLTIPCLRVAEAAQVDDGTDAVRPHQPFQFGGRRLAPAVDGTGDNNVDVAEEQVVDDLADDAQEQPEGAAPNDAPASDQRRRGPGGASEAVPAAITVSSVERARRRARTPPAGAEGSAGRKCRAMTIPISAGPRLWLQFPNGASRERQRPEVCGLRSLTLPARHMTLPARPIRERPSSRATRSSSCGVALLTAAAGSCE